MGLITRIKSEICRRYYPWRIQKRAARCGKGLYVGGKSFVTEKTYLGDRVNFNGMEIHGNGKVTIGDYFHSGTGCQIITSFHNYDSGNAIPYDDTFIDKDVVIGNNVWLGNNVIILGGSTIGEGAIIQAGSVVSKEESKKKECCRDRSAFEERLSVIMSGHSDRVTHSRQEGLYLHTHWQ